MSSTGLAEPLIRASEVGQYGFCSRAWWLATVHGYRSANQAALQAGSRAHQRHGAKLSLARRGRRLGYILLGVGGMGLLLLGAWLVTGGSL
jgi:hypothetical protein